MRSLVYSVLHESSLLLYVPTRLIQTGLYNFMASSLFVYPLICE